MRQALRNLRRNPGFSVLVVLVLASGIAASTAGFRFIHTLLLQQPAFRDLDRLVGIYGTRDGHYRMSFISYADYQTYRRSLRSFVDVAAVGWTWVWLNQAEKSREFRAAQVPSHFFDLVGVRPQLGRFFTAEEDAEPVVVLSDEVWRQQFGGRADIVGQVVRLRKEFFTVIGVAPRDLKGLHAIESFGFWLPLSIVPLQDRQPRLFGDSERWLDLIGRLKPGVPPETAQAELAAVTQSLVDQDPKRRHGLAVATAPLKGIDPMAQASVRRASLILAIGLSLLLLISCANLAGLMLSRSLDRQKEIAIRLSLGATRARIVGQLLAESVLLSAAGGFTGFLLSWWVRDLLMMNAYYDTKLPDSGLGPAVLGFAMAISCLTGLLFGFAPALQTSRPNLVDALKSTGASPGHERSLWRNGLIVAQVALCMTLLAAAGLLLRSLRNVIDVPGNQYSSVASFRMRPSRIGITAEQGERYNRRLIRDLQAAPGVESVALASVGPTVGWGWTVDIRKAASPSMEMLSNNVTPGYFEMLGIVVLRGRSFQERDGPNAAPVAIVNETLARRLWPDQDPVGQLLIIQDKPHTIVGVAQDTHVGRGTQGMAPYLYRPYWQVREVDSRLLVQVRGDAQKMIEPLRRIIVRVDPEVHVGQEMTLFERAAISFTQERVMSRALSFSAVSALLLSAVGLYAALAFSVHRRRREIGIRMALGARPRAVLVMILTQGLRVVGFGLLLGTAGAAIAGRLLDSSLYGVGRFDPGVLGVVVLVLAVSAILASYLPARRAAAVDPMRVLRAE